jgi:hypothetical protein
MLIVDPPGILFKIEARLPRLHRLWQADLGIARASLVKGTNWSALRYLHLDEADRMAG